METIGEVNGESFKTVNREDFISWEEYFICLAKISALRSKDPNTKVGACLVDENNKVISLGYNGMPIGCLDSKMPWKRDSKDWLNTKYPFVCHAELNAILNCSGKIPENATLYTTLFPCNECAKALIQSRIKKIIYEEDKYDGSKSNIAAKKMFKMVGVILKKYQNKGKSLNLII